MPSGSRVIYTANMPGKAITADGRLEYTDVHADHFGHGLHHTVHIKTLLLHVANGLDTLFDKGNKKRVQFNDQAENWSDFRNRIYQELTGFDYRRVNDYKNEIKEHQGYLLPPEYHKKRGPEKIKLEVENPGLEKWLEDEARKANKGRYLTVQKLLHAYKQDLPLLGPVRPNQQQQQLQRIISEKVFRRALHALNFRYTERRFKRLEARESPRILADLDRVLKWWKANTHRVWSDIAGKHVWKFIRWVSFMDESYMRAGEYRSRSWTNANTRTRSIMNKDSRLVLLHSIFSHRNDKLPCKYWCAEWKKKRQAGFPGGQYFGKCDAAVMTEYFKEIFLAFGAHPDGVDQKEENIVWCDNASMHKRIREEMRTAEDIIDWVSEEPTIDESVQNVIEALVQSAPGPLPERANLLKALRDNGIETFELAATAKVYNARVMYLPAYYSELNPIELVWCEIKRYYRDDTNPEDPWEVRLQAACDSITPSFIECCFDRSIRWALRKYDERFPAAEAAEPPAAPPAPAEDELDLGDEPEEDPEDEELFEELWQAEMVDEFPPEDEEEGGEAA